jgi:hypothetical protein
MFICCQLRGDGAEGDTAPESARLSQLSHSGRAVGGCITLLLFVHSEYLQLGGKIHVPAGVTIMIPIYHIHHNPEYWPDPEAFKPERFREVRP